ncbi:MAG: class I SAM-dependent methyltransferase [Candidatus Heimdallarchaeota archaeon]|nr:class I SAM-dependent methyltransferase [Candidatus Heimdallarchaeota archaeon]
MSDFSLAPAITPACHPGTGLEIGPSRHKRKRLSFRERWNFGLMYQHPVIYNFSIWMNDPQQKIPKALASRVAGNSVLDLGCGTALLRKFLPAEIDYIGVDLNEVFLSYAARKFSGYYYKRDILGDLSGFKADTVVLSDVLHHVTPYHPLLIQNAIRCARQKILIAACFERGNGVFKTLTEFISRHILDKDGFNKQRAKAGWLNRESLVEFLSSYGATNFDIGSSHVLCEILINR